MSVHKIICGKSEIELKQFDDNMFDSCVTDPPYGLEFMGKDWDKFQSAKTFGGGGASIDSPYARGEGNKTPRFYHINLQAFQQFTYQWATELYRVMKPGAHILVFGGDRTEHRMKCAIEDAGFEIRGTIVWIYGSGFPKSSDISKNLDKMAGKEREVIGIKQGHEEFANRGYLSSVQSLKGTFGNEGGFARPWMDDPEKVERYHQLTAPATEEAIQWDGWGTGLKPAVELICMARKPISERNIASNVLKWGVGGLNIAACRIVSDENVTIHGSKKSSNTFSQVTPCEPFQTDGQKIGRFPANLILECCCEDDELVEGKAISGGGIQKGINDSIYGQTKGHDIKYFNYGDENGNEKCLIHTNPNCVCRMLDEQSGELTSEVLAAHHISKDRNLACYGKWKEGTIGEKHNGQSFGGDKGGVSRFFYQAKASQNERWFYCTICKQAYPMKERDKHIHGAPEETKYQYLEFHPTQKPESLISYLMRLITPPNGMTIDPFLGSGTGIISAEREGFNCVGIDSKPEYCEIAYKRGKSELIQQKISGEQSLIKRRGF